MKFAAFLLFLLTGIAVFWQCSDMISTLRSSDAGPTVMVVLWLPTVGLRISGLLAFADLRASAIAGGVCLLIITGFYALTLFSIESFSFAEHCRAEGFAVIAYGENVSDAGDFRPGAKAAQEFCVRAPLK